jgi:hypothetical protein
VRDRLGMVHMNEIRTKAKRKHAKCDLLLLYKAFAKEQRKATQIDVKLFWGF